MALEKNGAASKERKSELKERISVVDYWNEGRCLHSWMDESVRDIKTCFDSAACRS